MSEIKYETLIGLLKGISQEAKRTVYVFEIPGKRYESRVSGFEPNLPELIVEHAYEFEVQHKPMGSEPGKFFHNLVRESNEGPYKITEVSMEKYKELLKEIPAAESTGSTGSPPSQQKEEKGVDWGAKDRRIVRQNSLTQANSWFATIAVASPKTLVDAAKDETVKKLFFEMAESCEKWVYRGMGEGKPLGKAIAEKKAEKDAVDATASSADDISAPL